MLLAFDNLPQKPASFDSEESASPKMHSHFELSEAAVEEVAEYVPQVLSIKMLFGRIIVSPVCISISLLCSTQQ